MPLMAPECFIHSSRASNEAPAQSWPKVPPSVLSPLVCQEGNQPIPLWDRICADATGLTFHCFYHGLSLESTLDTNGFRRHHQYPSILFLKPPHPLYKKHQPGDKLCLGPCSDSKGPHSCGLYINSVVTKGFSSRTQFC